MTAFAADNELPPVVVTATRTAQTVDETLASVTVITRADIERKQARSVEEILGGIEGISIANTGGRGKQTSLFMRGASSTQVLVLIDGIKAGSPTTGQMAFQDLPVELIDRIEIVRGPRSSLYGSEAIGGVIQIFTKKGGGALTPSFSLGGGSLRTGQATAGLSGGGDRGWFNIGVSGFSTRGFDACRGRSSPFAGCGTEEPDRDGYRNIAGTLRGGFRFNERIEAEVHGMHAEGRNKYDGFFNESHVAQQVFGTRVRITPINPWQLNFSAGRRTDNSDNFKDGAFKSRFNTQRDTLALQSDLTVEKRQLLTLGIDHQQDRVTESTDAFSVRSRENRGLFAQYQIGVGQFDLQGSARHDDNEQFGSYNTGALAWGYAVTSGLRMVASHGTAFKAPTFNDLYFNDGFFTGNPNLRPERSRTTEAGLRGTPAWGRWSLNAFQTEIRDLIITTPSFTTAQNLDEARIQGAEFALVTRVGAWEFATQVTALRPENATPGANEGKILPRRSQRSARIDIDRRFGAHRIGLSVFGDAKRFDDAANTTELGGYALLDLRWEYAFAKDWRLQARGANLLDKRYETTAFYNQPGRAFFLTARYQLSRP
ncbi:MAG: TonB-dependent vitamin B12 receptor [Betaproteobacteria bacterium]|nr:TonB-dependent vitamin B12 receptor [Betaproteobacteria bacterium]